MRSSKAWRQVQGWMDYYALDEVAFATLVEGFGACSADAVLSALDGERRPPFVVARAVEDVTGVDAHDWYLDERPLAKRGPESTPAPAVEDAASEPDLDVSSLVA